MKMSEEHTEATLHDYVSCLARLDENGVTFVLVAGHAVNAWAEFFQERDPFLNQYRPFTSKDADLIGKRDELYHIARLIPGTLQRYRDMRTPVLGTFVTDTDPPLKLELLQSLYGMGGSDRIIARAKRFGPIPVIDPVLLLVSKAHNLGGLDQEDRQDEKHLKMMARISVCYFSDLLAGVGNQITEREFINEMKLLITLSSGRGAERGIAKAGLEVPEFFPLAQLRETAFEKVKRFVAQQFSSEF